MSKKFLTPIQLPSNPSNPLEAATKQYVDTKANGQQTQTLPALTAGVWFTTSIACDQANRQPIVSFGDLFSLEPYDLDWRMRADIGNIIEVRSEVAVPANKIRMTVIQ